jgi:nitrate/nitrite transporter NarK
MLIGVTAFIIYTFFDKKLDASENKLESEQEEDEFHPRDIITIIKNKGFWYIAILCVLFYGAVFPFLFYATDLMINKYNVSPNLAGAIPALLPFGTIFLTSLFGTIYDRKGKGATIMLIGSVMLIFDIKYFVFICFYSTKKRRQEKRIRIGITKYSIVKNIF